METTRILPDRLDFSCAWDYTVHGEQQWRYLTAEYLPFYDLGKSTIDTINRLSPSYVDAPESTHQAMHGTMGHMSVVANTALVEAGIMLTLQGDDSQPNVVFTEALKQEAADFKRRFPEQVTELMPAQADLLAQSALENEAALRRLVSRLRVTYRNCEDIQAVDLCAGLFIRRIKAAYQQVKMIDPTLFVHESAFDIGDWPEDDGQGPMGIDPRPNDGSDGSGTVATSTNDRILAGV